jgi:hypothetical protein
MSGVGREQFPGPAALGRVRASTAELRPQTRAAQLAAKAILHGRSKRRRHVAAESTQKAEGRQKAQGKRHKAKKFTGWFEAAAP